MTLRSSRETVSYVPYILKPNTSPTTIIMIFIALPSPPSRFHLQLQLNKSSRMKVNFPKVVTNQQSNIAQTEMTFVVIKVGRVFKMLTLASNCLESIQSKSPSIKPGSYASSLCLSRYLLSVVFTTFHQD